MLYWGKTSIVYSPIYTKILFDRDFLGSEGSKFSAGSKFFDTPCSIGPELGFISLKCMENHF